MLSTLLPFEIQQYRKNGSATPAITLNVSILEKDLDYHYEDAFDFFRLTKGRNDVQFASPCSSMSCHG